MVPVYADTPPPSSTAPPPGPWAVAPESPALGFAAPRLHPRRRKALLISGGVLLGVGAILTGIGAGMAVNGQREQAVCNSEPDPPFLCGLGGAIDQGIGNMVMGFGVPHFVAGIITITLGATDH